jgi:hypothetical protein
MAKTRETHELNRRLFIEWSKGTLLKRGRNCKVLVLDGSDFARQCEAGKRITQVTSDGKGYTEDVVG